MQYKHNLLKPISTALLLAGCVLTQQAAQAVLPGKAVLNFSDGVNGCIAGAGGTYPACNYGATTVTPGSYFAMNLNGGGFGESERVAMLSAGTGITLETAQSVGEIDLDWSFGGRFGRHLTFNALATTSTGANTYDVTMAGWTVNWGSEGNIDMGAGTATLTCAVDCAAGDTFSLDYETTVPSGAFINVPYQLYLEGTIGIDNTAPTTSNGSISVVADTNHPWSATIGDVDGDTLSCTIVTDGANAGSATTCTASALTNGTGTVSGTYTPTGGAGFTGTDSFTYKVTDDSLVDSNISTIDIEVAADPAPSCVNLSGTSTASGTAVDITIDVTDTNVCTDAVGSIVANTLAVSASSANSGTVTVASGVATYTPPAGFAGTDTFTYTVDDDNSGTSTPATVTVTVVTSSASTPTSPEGVLTCGTTAVSVSNTSCVVSTTDIGVEDQGFGTGQGVSQSCIGGCFDFTISGVTTGTQAQVVLPLSTTIPAATASNQGHKIVYRKLMSTGWKDFDLTDDSIASAAGTISGSDTICPQANDASYINGLNAGDRCLRLTITDGGPNDADGLANGTVVDPGGISETFFTSGSDGCSMSNTPASARDHADWWLVAGFLTMLGLFRLRNKAQ